MVTKNIETKIFNVLKSHNAMIAPITIILQNNSEIKFNPFDCNFKDMKYFVSIDGENMSALVKYTDIRQIFIRYGQISMKLYESD